MASPNRTRKLTPEQVREIRRLCRTYEQRPDGSTTWLSEYTLGRRYGVSQKTVYELVARRTYQDVE